MPPLIFGDIVRYGTGAGVFGVFLRSSRSGYVLIADSFPEIIEIPTEEIDLIWRHGKVFWEIK